MEFCYHCYKKTPSFVNTKNSCCAVSSEACYGCAVCVGSKNGPYTIVLIVLIDLFGHLMNIFNVKYYHTKRKRFQNQIL